MFQAAVYGSTHINAAYISAAVDAWHQVTTERFLNVLGSDHLTADFSGYNIGGRIEGGYRFALPGAMGWPGQYGLTPYAAGQVQVFHTPTYSEHAVSGSSVFALTYDARTATTLRTELGAWLDWSSPIDHHTTVVLRTRAAWAHDEWSSPSINARFQSLPGSASFTVVGAEPAICCSCPPVRNSCSGTVSPSPRGSTANLRRGRGNTRDRTAALHLVGTHH